MSKFSFESLFETLVRQPSVRRPILGSSPVNKSNYWPNPSNPSIYSRDFGKCWPLRDTDSTNRLTPIGSPLKYSPRNWGSSVHTFNEKPIKDFSGNLFMDEDSSDSKYEFETNGIDVPINEYQPIVRVSVPQATTSAQNYQLFNGFSYAKIRSAVGDGDGSYTYRPRNKRRVKTQTFCSFCKNNNETPDVYNSHVVKDPYGRTTCPVLRGYNCPKCGSGGGDNGHTIRYCPLNKPGVPDYIPSVIKQLKNSRSADGKKRGTV